jgi:type VI secretion system secreted protein VgrG
MESGPPLAGSTIRAASPMGVAMPKAMEISTPELGEGVLLFHRMHAREELGRMSEYRLELLSESKDVALDKILGQNVTIKLQLSDDESYRYFNGFVSRFSAGGMYGRYFRYSAEVRPWLWFLTRTADCRIFQEKSVPEIVVEVLADHPGLGSHELDLTESYPKRTYCVQYRETDFNFISRLLEHEGISYYYRHDEDHHTVVLTDTKHYPNPGYETLKFIAPAHFVRPDVDHVSSWDFSREVQPGVYAHTDYDFERPSVDLRTKQPLQRTYKPSDYEVFDYPGIYLQKSDGQYLAKVRIEEYGSQFEMSEGITNCRGLCVGSLFNLADFEREDQNGEHLVVGATFDLEYSEYEGMPGSGGTSYQCRFVSVSTKTQRPFRPQRLTAHPFVQGPQTAVVVGPAGEEIFTDKYGRVKVQFHWDRRGKRDDQSSCWVRVSYPWAGKAWGGVAIPRIGQEVVVDFLEGDPDQPLITGRVYNQEQMRPYTLPGNKTQSGMKSRSSMRGSPANFNEIRFEDLKGSEQLFIHAEKNQDIEVENDETHWVGHDRTKTIDHDETTHVKHDRTETVDNDETITIHGNRTETVDKDETIAIHENRTETVDKDQSIDVGGNASMSVGKDEARDVGGKRSTTVGKDDLLNVGKNYVVDAGDSITIKTGDASIVMKKDGTIQVKGKNISIIGSGKINVKADSDVVVKGSKVGIN